MQELINIFVKSIFVEECLAVDYGTMIAYVK